MRLHRRPLLRSIGSGAACALTAFLVLAVTTGVCGVLAVSTGGSVHVPGLLTMVPDDLPRLAHATFVPIGSAVWFVVLTSGLIVLDGIAKRRRYRRRRRL
jgi:uncharacterized membrane protein YozB (DUF420 family)